MKLKFPKLKTKHKINIINILAFIPFLLTLLYALKGYEQTSKYKLIWWPKLRGFSNDSVVITENIEGSSILFIIILLIILTIRQAIKIGEIYSNSPKTYLPVLISYTVSDIIDIISFFIFINLLIDFQYNNSGGNLFLLIIASISIILYKVIEINNSNSDSYNHNNGGLNLHGSVKNYLNDLFPYIDRKEELIKNYKKIIK